jgi:hypothetical protein
MAHALSTPAAAGAAATTVLCAPHAPSSNTMDKSFQLNICLEGQAMATGAPAKKVALGRAQLLNRT